MIALVLGVVGLYVVIMGQLTLGGEAWRGILGTLLSVLCFAMSAVAVKQVNAGLHPLVQTSGTLWLSSLGFIASIPIFGIHIPEQVSVTSWMGLGYLVSCGSLLGFVLYFYILKYLPTARVALITLIAPVLAMLWGNLLKGEVMTITSLLGCFALLLALALYQWHQRLDQGLKSVFLRLGIGQRSLEFKQKKS
jgi:drug/metabolite transporter (DMT)-like permease